MTAASGLFVAVYYLFFDHEGSTNSGDIQQKVATYVINEVTKIPGNLYKAFRCLLIEFHPKKHQGISSVKTRLPLM